MDAGYAQNLGGCQHSHIQPFFLLVLPQDYSQNKFDAAIVNGANLSGSDILLDASLAQYIVLPSKVGHRLKAVKSYTIICWIRTSSVRDFHNFVCCLACLRTRAKGQ